LALPISREHDAKWISSSISATRQMFLKRCYELVEALRGSVMLTRSEFFVFRDDPPLR
jgi:hypothetical protein